MPPAPNETAQCSDCYAVLFTEEMNRCPEGHWICPGCVCDCTARSANRASVALLAAVGRERDAAGVRVRLAG